MSRKRPADGAPCGPPLTARSSREDVVEWLTTFLPADICERLDSQWRAQNELVDGETLLDWAAGGERELLQLGMSQTVARRVHHRIQQQLCEDSQQQLTEPGSEADQSGRPASLAPAAQQRQHDAGPVSTSRAQVSELQGQRQQQQQQHQQQQRQKQQPLLPLQQQEQQQPPLQSSQQQEQQQPPPQPSQRQQQGGRSRQAEQIGAQGSQSQGAEEAEEQQQQPELPQPQQQFPQPTQQQPRAPQRRAAGLVGAAGQLRVVEQQPPLRPAEQLEAEPAHKQPAPACQSQARQNQQQGGQEQRRNQEPPGLVQQAQQEQQAPQQAPQQAQQEQQHGGRRVAASGSPDAVPPAAAHGPIVEDLGPQAHEAQYAVDWARRCRADLPLIFQRMSFAELRSLVVQEHQLPGIHLCLRQAPFGMARLADTHRDIAVIARQLTSYVFTGSAYVGAPVLIADTVSREQVQELLRRHCDRALRDFVREDLSLRYQHVPACEDPHDLAWKLWCYPEGPADVPYECPLATKSCQVDRLPDDDAWQPGEMLPYRTFEDALLEGQLKLKDPDMRAFCVYQLSELSLLPRVAIWAVVSPDESVVELQLVQRSHRGTCKPSLVNGTYMRQATVSSPGGLMHVDLGAILRSMDAVAEPEPKAQLARMMQAQEQLQAQLARHEFPVQLEAPLSPQQFTQLLSAVQDAQPRELPRSVAAHLQQLPDHIKRTLDSAQCEALARLVHEERAAGGAARHLWMRWEVEEGEEDGAKARCYFSPMLNQLRTCWSQIEADHWVHACGGAGWVASKSGKAALVAGAVQLNPPPAGWSKNRAWQSPRAGDYLASVLNNMPHGGTLVVVHSSALSHWYDGLRSAAPRARILEWAGQGHMLWASEGGHAASQPSWTLNCRELAGYDIVLTTYRAAVDLHSLCHVRWWRILVDVQHGVGPFMNDKQHTWFAQHRWALCNHSAKDIRQAVSACAEFLRLAPCDVLLRRFPVALAHVLQSFLIRAAG